MQKMNRHDSVLAEFGLKKTPSANAGIPVITNDDLELFLTQQGDAFRKRFNEQAMGQTQSPDGIYYYDVADILRTIQTGVPKHDWD